MKFISYLRFVEPTESAEADHEYSGNVRLKQLVETFVLRVGRPTMHVVKRSLSVPEGRANLYTLNGIPWSCKSKCRQTL
jgi:hypothetical protein